MSANNASPPQGRSRRWRWPVALSLGVTGVVALPLAACRGGSTFMSVAVMCVLKVMHNEGATATRVSAYLGTCLP
jgi:hypothetical protein